MGVSDNRVRYFVRPNPLLAFVILFGLWMCWCMIYAPELVPYNYLGPLGRFYAFLTFQANPIWKYTLAIAALSLHIVESFIALYLTGKKGVTDSVTKFKWWLCTFLFGIFTMRHLLKLKSKEL